tara:strand:+ start:1277 stop:2056 length:780 start_codon:yes stop_codon:yes gene_type:complete
MEIKIVNQLSDNYSYVLYNDIDRKTIVIDPADEIPIIDLILNYDLKPVAILATHHHNDHTSGIKGLKKRFNIDVYSPNNNIEGTTFLLQDNQKINFDFINFEIISTPGHTLDHVVYYSKKEKILFSGDTLFYYGCGRIFEGTNKQMLNSLNKIKSLPDDTKVYCGHEYTYKNLEFVLDELVHRQDKGDEKLNCRKMIEEKGSSMPFYLGHQKDRNPFLNCNDIHYKQEIADFHKNKGKIRADASELDFFTYIRKKRNNF